MNKINKNKTNYKNKIIVCSYNNKSNILYFTQKNSKIRTFNIVNNYLIYIDAYQVDKST